MKGKGQEGGREREREGREGGSERGRDAVRCKREGEETLQVKDVALEEDTAIRDRAAHGARACCKGLVSSSEVQYEQDTAITDRGAHGALQDSKLPGGFSLVSN